MGPALLLLVLALSHFSWPARGDLLDVFDDFVDALYDYANNTTEEIETEAASEFHLSWLLELFDEPNGCDPNPCMNEGTCKPKSSGGYTCSCVQLYSGKNCEKFVNPCKKVNCGSGECVLTKTAPFYECKCRPPFRPPHCKKGAACRPNLCLNGGTCQKGQARSQFTCLCPSGYSGKLCQVGPGDCYNGDGQSYRGFVSETEDGQDCLPWNSHLVPYSQYEHDGLGPHSYCSNKTADMQVELGGVMIFKKDNSEQIIPVENYIIHEKYSATDEALYNDIALLKLKGPKGQCAKETRYVKTACLPTGPFPDSSECTISGWGETETVYLSHSLLSAQVRLISQERCTAPDVLGDRVDDSMICAGKMQGGVDTCQGDSGGPLVCQKDGVHYVYGVVSWGDECGSKNKPGVYARVTKFVDWINAKIQTG
ncbi:hypothetical protein ACEWY4_025699 [Coilia grayii]|uniref:trypsin n=1 Tax=Coilia grayii TaxID=363190 RepID=A0ABD1ISN1_9TELE